MVLTSILVYGSLTAILFFSGKFAAERQEIRWRMGMDTPFFAPEIILALLAFAFVCGARWNVGADHLSYLKDYQYLQQTGHFFSRDDYEPGFKFISKFFAFFNIHFFFYFALWGFLQLFFVLFAFKDERNFYPYFAIIIILGELFFTWNNGMRQSLASCIFLYSYKYIEEKHFLKFLITIIAASLIHYSAIFCIIFYFILNRDIPFNKYIYLLLLVISVIIGRISFLANFIQNIGQILSAVGYDEYEKTKTTINNLSNFGGRSLILLTICAVNIWFLPEIYKYFNYGKRIKIFFILYFLGIISYFMLLNSSILARGTYYFSIFQLPSLAYLFLYTKNNKKIIYYGLIALFVIYSLASYYLDLSRPADFTNYRFFWNHII